MNRRTLLTGLVALAACQPGASTQTQLQTLAGLATGGVDAVAAVILGKPGLASGTAAKVTEAQSEVDAANAVIQKAAATNAANAQLLATALQAAKPVLIAAVPAGSDEALAVTAAFALVPTILAAAGVASAPAARGPMTMDQATAVDVLKRYQRR